MYKIGVVVASDKLVRYPQINFKGIINNSNRNLYEFIVFQQEQYDRLFSEMKLGALDAVIFSSNVSNDERIRNLILDNRDTITQFIKQGKGVLLLLQYHLARENKVFNIFDKNIFNDEETADNTDNNSSEEKGLFDVFSISAEHQNTIVEKENKSDKNNKFDESKVRLDTNSILLSYPNPISLEKIYDQSQDNNNGFAKSFAPAYIGWYQHAYFEAPLYLNVTNTELLNENDKERDEPHKPLLIYSPNNERRIVITTLPADLQKQNALLENMISYIARGKPEAILWKDKDSCKDSCEKCEKLCNAEDYLTKAKIHFFTINKDEIKTQKNNIERSKYVIACNEYAYRKASDEEIYLPIKTSLYSIMAASKSEASNVQDKDSKTDAKSLDTKTEDSNNRGNTSDADIKRIRKRIIVDVPAKSQIELWAIQGFNYLLDRFPSNESTNNKWHTLYATEQVLKLAEDINESIPKHIKKQIGNYLREHHIEGNNTFDNDEQSTLTANRICELLKIEDSLKFKWTQSGGDTVDTQKGDNAIDVSETSLLDLAKLINNTDNLDDVEKIEDIISRFDSEFDSENPKIEGASATDVLELFHAWMKKDEWKRKKSINVSSATLFDLAQLILNTESENLKDLPHINAIITRFVTERNPKRAAWEDDVMTTACVLRALLKIDKCESITSLTNLICSCYDSKDDLELTVALSKSVERARDSEFDIRQQLNNIVKQNSSIEEKEDLINSLKNKQLRTCAVAIVLLGICFLAVILLVSFIIKAKHMDLSNYNSEVSDFFNSWGLIEIILSTSATFVTIILFKILSNSEIREKLKKKLMKIVERKQRQQNRQQKKEERQQKKMKGKTKKEKKRRKTNKGNKEDSAQTINDDVKEDKSES